MDDRTFVILFEVHVDGRTHAAARMFEMFASPVFFASMVPVGCLSTVLPLRVPRTTTDGVARRRCEQRGALPASPRLTVSVVDHFIVE